MTITVLLRDFGSNAIARIPAAFGDKSAPEVVSWRGRLFLRRSVATDTTTYWELRPFVLDGFQAQETRP